MIHNYVSLDLGCHVLYFPHQSLKGMVVVKYKHEIDTCICTHNVSDSSSIWIASIYTWLYNCGVCCTAEAGSLQMDCSLCQHFIFSHSIMLMWSCLILAVEQHLWHVRCKTILIYNAHIHKFINLGSYNWGKWKFSIGVV